jgi:hypothetical protein
MSHERFNAAQRDLPRSPARAATRRRKGSHKCDATSERNVYAASLAECIASGIALTSSCKRRGKDREWDNSQTTTLPAGYGDFHVAYSSPKMDRADPRPLYHARQDGTAPCLSCRCSAAVSLATGTMAELEFAYCCAHKPTTFATARNVFGPAVPVDCRSIVPVLPPEEISNFTKDFLAYAQSASSTDG